MEKLNRKREVWLTLWGITVALFIQVIYDYFGVFGTMWQLIIGLVLASGFFITLLLTMQIWNKKPKEK